MINNNPRPKSILRKKRIKRHSIIKPSQPSKPPPTSSVSKAEADTPKQRSSLKFAAPIKIIIIDPKSEYCKAVWCAIGIALTNLAIGAVLMSVFHYSLVKHDAHAIVCAVAYHFFSAEAILALHYANGWSSPMRIRHRKFAHIFLNICGIICATVGTTILFVKVGISKEIVEKPHGITGILTYILVILSAIFGPLAYYRRKTCAITLHMSLGIITFIMSSLCVCFGLTLKSFKTWAGDTVVYLLISFVIYYTVFIVTGSFMKCVSRL